ncbi:hypothetical protein HYE82_10300 [Streptomyces sp. BR123]|uniref:hypothetical protein n=1 Tax=Streptomyces sp. BR123 TaxID=2749828 RepID=UPI0015C44203|nr:hypothetical protein [Streptomyces sp. BR123]NXY94776.1 hypothetical protein [Streptomyces sp. BR123]
MLRLRRPRPAAWDTIVEAACCGSPEVYWSAQQVIVQAGRAAAPYADRLAARLDGLLRGTEDYLIADLAVALAGVGDVRAMAGLHRLAAQERLWRDCSHLSPALAALPAAELLPLLRRELGADPAAAENAPALAVLSAWGSEAAPALPEVTACLEGPYAYDAARVLGRIGPPAAAAAGRLAEYATGAGRPPGPYGPDARGTWHGVRMAAWAHYRVTGDGSLALRRYAADLGSGLGSRVLPYLADFGPAAARHTGAVRALMDSPGAWTRVAAAHAWWRITGDPEPAVPVLLAAVDPEWDGHIAYPTPRAVRHLGEIGAPAAAAEPVLTRLLERGTRLGHPWQRIRILADDAFSRTLTKALAGLGPRSPA